MRKKEPQKVSWEERQGRWARLQSTERSGENIGVGARWKRREKTRGK